jgi:hypothetical protein
MSMYNNYDQEMSQKRESKKKSDSIVRVISALIGLALVVFAIYAGYKLIFVLGPSSKSISGSRIMKTEKRKLPAFSSIDSDGGYEIEILCHERRDFQITGDDNILPLITTEVKGSVLKISCNKIVLPSKPIKIKISTPDIETLRISGSGVVTISQIRNSCLKLNVNGAAKVKADGTTDLLFVDINGAGNVEGTSLRAGKAMVSINGAGAVGLAVANELDVKIVGTGMVIYTGNPKVTQKIMGTGGVRRIQPNTDEPGLQ